MKIYLNKCRFWIIDRDLTKKELYGVRYNYPNPEGWRDLKFVGLDIPVDVIPMETVVCVSLARWWQQDENTRQRCYLRPSGWYLNGTIQNRSIDDFPF